MTRFICALGLRRQVQKKTLDVLFPRFFFDFSFDSFPAPFLDLLWKEIISTSHLSGPFFIPLDEAILKKILPLLLESSPEFYLVHSFFEKSSITSYSSSDLIFFVTEFSSSFLESNALQSVEEAYFKLQLLSHRHFQPNQLSLKGLFSVLPNLAWTNQGPLFPEEVLKAQIQARFTCSPLIISHLDKIPYLLDYYVPSGVRIADSSRVRLGAYLGEGCTVMPAGYVNFNAGAEGPSMIEGRISAGVFVEKNSDIGGGASIMGTLSGGNQLTISIGPQCLLGANSGTGISLGRGCTIAAGLYIYAGMKIALLNRDGQPCDLLGATVISGQNIVKALALSGRDYMLFIRDSQSGQVCCKPNTKVIALNEELHKN